MEEDGGARVRLTSEIGVSGLMRLMLPMIERTVRKNVDAEFAVLKKLLESAPTASAPALTRTTGPRAR
jgi:hypothetical protein